MKGAQRQLPMDFPFNHTTQTRSVGPVVRDATARSLGRIRPAFVRRVGVPLAALGLAGGCGGGGGPNLELSATTAPSSSIAGPETDPEPAPASSTTDPPTPAGDLVVGDAWVDVTSNLVGIESYCGTLSFVSAPPHEDRVLASVVGQGLFSIEPGSDEWTAFGRGPDSAPIDHRTSGFVYDPANPDTFWESGFFSLGAPPNARASSVNRTDDGGATFVAVGNELPADLVSVDLSDPQRRTLLMGLRGGARDRRVLRSTDGGSTWADVTDGLPGDLGEASFPHIVDANTHLLGTHKGDRGEGASPGIFRTDDGGDTWVKVFEEGVAGPPLASTDGRLYWLLDNGGIVSSSDTGLTWDVIRRDGPLGAGQRADARRNRIVETSDGAWLVLEAESMVMSRDRGGSWQRVGPPLPVRTPAGFAYSESQDAVYVWSNYCSHQDGVNPVIEKSINRLELDLDP